MKVATRFCFQGDIALFYMGKVPLPEGVKEVGREPDGSLIVTHSETGHHHTVEDPYVRMFEEDSMVCYLQMGDTVDFTLQHLRPNDTHEPIKFLGEPGGVWMVRRQREETPEGWRQVRD